MNLKQKLARLAPLAGPGRTATSEALPPEALLSGGGAVLPSVPSARGEQQPLDLALPGGLSGADPHCPAPAAMPKSAGGPASPRSPTPASGSEASHRIRRGLAVLGAKGGLGRGSDPPQRASPGTSAPHSSPVGPSTPSPEGRQQLPVETVATAAGALHLRALPHPVDHHHGTVRLANAASVSTATVAKLALDPSLEGTDFSRALFLDLETTGLAGGTGTLPVVVGLAWFEDGAFQMEQLFLRRPGEERPMLARVAERLASASGVVTYNGKTFDWPLLRSRFVMNRMKDPSPPPHLDLLHCARRIFKWRGGGAKLAEIEREVIGYHRVGDVDGALIPELYFRYLRSGNPGPLAPVLEHNVHDIRLLAALLAHLCEQFEAAPPAGDPRDLLGYAHLAFRAEDLPRASAFSAGVISSLQGPENSGRAGARNLAAEALTLSARVALRIGEPQLAADSLERALRGCRPQVRSELHLALAKIYEHRLRDFASALRHAALTSPTEPGEEQTRRLERLARRGARTAPGS
ncbi:MAG: ribonuclease H-like domain-containing protein [Myxococcota bacterium]|nr:ribonuclease H-like domain-containing protein [Myxococcota bacterium]